MTTADDAAATPSDRIAATARQVLGQDPTASMADVAEAAGISRATLHRHFRTRGDLLAAAGVTPDAGTRERVLAAAAELIARDGLAAMSMDEVAVRADVSRASVYRLFPGKPALFEALVNAYSPFEPIAALMAEIGDRPVDEVIPRLYRSIAGIAAANLGIMRSIFLEVTSGSPDAVEGAGRPLRGMVGALGSYLEREMAADRVPRMHPALAVEALLGPLVFFMLTRPYAERIAGLDVSLEDAVEQLGVIALRGLRSPSMRPESRPERRDATSQE